MDPFSIESEWICSVSAFCLKIKSFVKELAIIVREIRAEWIIWLYKLLEPNEFCILDTCMLGFFFHLILQ